MKRITLLMISVLIYQIIFSQEPDTTSVNVGKKNIVTVAEDENKTDVRVLDDDVVVNVNEDEDTVKIKLGNKAVRITDTEEGTNIEIIKMEDFEKHGWSKKEKKFSGHWAGFELGLNDFLTPDFNFAGTVPETNYLDLNTGRSWNANINFIQYSLPMSSGIGWITGLGYERNNYNFDRNNSIGKDSAGNIGPVYPPDGITYIKSRLITNYLTLPLLLEFQFGPQKKGFISFGVIGGLKLWSTARTKYYAGGEKEKDKYKGDFNLSPFRYALTVRAGYKFVNFYANYGMIPLFTRNTGPEIYPVNIGLILIPFR